MALIVAGAAWIGALLLLTFHATAGLPTQRVGVRWVPAITDAERMRVEQEAGLVEGESHNERTWTYLMRDRSRGSIERLVSNPLVENTAHIDRTRFRVELDRPDLPAWLRSLEETGIVSALALLLLLAGAAAAWKARVALRSSVVASRRFAERTLSQFDVESATAAVERSPAAQSGSRRLLDLVLLTLAAVGLLWLGSRAMGVDRLHISFQNDQLNYITAARELVDSGAVNSHLIYPATLYQNKPRNYLYMPGFAYVLASSYKLFGYGVFQSLLPNLLSFVLTAICVYLIGARLGGRAVGLIGAGFFMLFPPNLFFAVTVMAESTLALATTLAMAVFIYLPARARLFCGPFLALLPFVFRETGALIVGPMLLLLLAGNGRRRFMKALTFAVMAFALLLLVFRSPISQERPIVANPFDDRFEAKFTDVVAARNAASSTRREWMQILEATVKRNVHEAFKSAVLRSEKGILFVVTVLVGAVGLRQRNMFCLAAAVFALLTFGTVVATYRWEFRILLLTVPTLAAALAVVLAKNPFGPLEKRSPTIHHAVAMTVLTILSTYTFARLNEYCSSIPTMDAWDDQSTRALEKIPIDQTRVLTAPNEAVFDYVLHHYPLRYAFPPANDETLDLLSARYPIGTVILPEESDLPWFKSGKLGEIGLAFSQTVRIGEQNYVVYQR